MLSIHIGGLTSAGMLAPWLVGQMIAGKGGDIAHGFEASLALIGVAILVSSLLGLWLVRPARTREQLETLEPRPLVVPQPG